MTLFTDSTSDPYPGRANNTTGRGAAAALKVNRVAGQRRLRIEVSPFDDRRRVPGRSTAMTTTTKPRSTRTTRMARTHARAHLFLPLSQRRPATKAWIPHAPTHLPGGPPLRTRCRSGGHRKENPTGPSRPQAFGIHPECPGPFPCRKWVEPQSPERTEKQLSKRPTKRRLSKSQKQSPPTRFRQVNTPTRQTPVPSIHQNRAHRLDSNQPRGKIPSPGLGQAEYRPAGAPRTR